MNNFTCNGDWLVDYADHELSASESALAELHLATCPCCAREVAALRHSRDRLSAYFSSAGAAIPVAARSERASRGITWNTAALALASTAAAALLISVVFFLGSERGHGDANVSPSARLPSAATAAGSLSEEEVLALITRETQIARLQAASEILAKEPGMNERHRALERYLSEAYGVTTVQPFEM